MRDSLKRDKTSAPLEWAGQLDRYRDQVRLTKGRRIAPHVSKSQLAVECDVSRSSALKNLRKNVMSVL